MTLIQNYGDSFEKLKVKFPFNTLETAVMFLKTGTDNKSQNGAEHNL